MLLISGRFATTALPLLHDMVQIKSIIIFCGRKREYLPLKVQYSKIKTVTDDFLEAYESCKAELQEAL